MTTNKPRLTAEQMAEIKKISDQFRNRLSDIISDFGIDLVSENHSWELTESDDLPPEIMDLEFTYEAILADMILQDIRREF